MPENRRILSVAVALVGIAFPAAAAADTIAPLPVTGPSSAAPDPALAVAAPARPAITPSGHELSILKAVNNIRAAHGRGPLTLGPRLHRAARAHSMDMARRGYFDHGPFVQRLRRFGVRSRLLGENLAYSMASGFSASVVIQMWLESPPHRALLLDGSFNRIGVGVAGGSTRLVTADFAG